MRSKLGIMPVVLIIEKGDLNSQFQLIFDYYHYYFKNTPFPGYVTVYQF